MKFKLFYSYSVDTDDLHWVQSTRKHMVTQLVSQAQLPLIQNAQTGNFIFKIRLGCLSDFALCLGASFHFRHCFYFMIYGKMVIRAVKICTQY